MRFKLDENIHPAAADLLKRHGHDAMTVYEQGLRGQDDEKVAEVCRVEKRALITLDLDFSDVRAYPPGDFAGIIVMRLSDQSRHAVLSGLERILPAFAAEPLIGNLWIVDEHQVRIRNRA
ncbi:MAG: DUF5615 family PIN-like protein [Planctomycetota bacterium]|nr:DUF5615 family PIN-like protein [Planctomycetaceae bacterium]MDQ3333508.1 DUF5615 family PIN-like protein [Planctomycetota bacterium]